MTPTYWVELSGDAAELGRRELESVMAARFPEAPPPREVPGRPGVQEVEVPDAQTLAFPLAFSRRILAPLAEGPVTRLANALSREPDRGTIAVRLFPGDRLPEALAAGVGEGYKRDEGRRIDLRHPKTTYVVLRGAGREEYVLCREETRTGRAFLRQQRPGDLPFRKPVTLSPLLARALVNLAAIPPGGSLLDPFCGTGAIGIDSGILGYRVIVSDKDGRMVRGTLTNLTRSSIVPTAVAQCDVSGVREALDGHLPVDAVVTDPPYGRASSTHGERAMDVVENALRVLRSVVRPGGRFVFMLPVPTMPEKALEGWTAVYPPLPLRVHSSLTRWVYVLRQTWDGA